MKIRNRQRVHLVDPSPWPILISIALGSWLISNMIIISQNRDKVITIVGLISVVVIFTIWIRDIIRESTYIGNHTIKVREGLMLGYILFIISEILIFISIFWTVLNTTISPNIEVLGMWPPIGIKELDWKSVPLNNTIILLGSGVTITIAHNKLISLNKKKSILYTIITIILSVWFTLNQYIEYKEASYTIRDSIYGSGFYFGTGLHGMHIIIGTIYLIVSLIRIYKSELTDSNHIGYESSILYWHFVDIIWLLLFIIIYNPLWEGI